MSAWDLPKTINIGGVEQPIRWWYGAILDILTIFNNPDYEVDEQWEVALRIFYPNFESIPSDKLEESAVKLKTFIDRGVSENDEHSPVLMDWEQDANMIFPAVNRVMGKEIRGDDTIHWWTFIGAYMEIGESLFSSVLNIRSKRAKGKKLEKYEKEFERENRSLITLKRRKSEAEIAKEEAEKKALEELLG